MKISTIVDKKHLGKESDCLGQYENFYYCRFQVVFRL